MWTKQQAMTADIADLNDEMVNASVALRDAEASYDKLAYRHRQLVAGGASQKEIERSYYSAEACRAAQRLDAAHGYYYLILRPARNARPRGALE